MKVPRALRAETAGSLYTTSAIGQISRLLLNTFVAELSPRHLAELPC
jgi:hypothetical protein